MGGCAGGEAQKKGSVKADVPELSKSLIIEQIGRMIGMSGKRIFISLLI